MKLKLEKLGNQFVQGPLIDHGLFPTKPWQIGEVRDVDESEAFQIMGKYPQFFTRQEKGDDVVEFSRARKSSRNKIVKPTGVK